MENHSLDEESKQELAFKASLIEQHMQELAERLEYISHQLSELEGFSKNMEFMKDAKSKEMFASLGRGIYAKSSLEDNNLFVNVGAGIIVKKTPEETLKIIEQQIKNFHEAKVSLMAQLEIYQGLMNQALAQAEKKRKE